MDSITQAVNTQRWATSANLDDDHTAFDPAAQRMLDERYLNGLAEIQIWLDQQGVNGRAIVARLRGLRTAAEIQQMYTDLHQTIDNPAIIAARLLGRNGGYYAYVE